ncbi:MAG: DEAD/DEAH box helicase family protein [Chloroflexi bacterium]|nr:DEAD/DEAH box helicase family protein [Chloroflexota bacterium]
MATEADTCRKHITPALQAAGWDDPPHSIAQERTFTDGRIVPVGDKIHRLQQKRADYLLRYRRDFTLAVVEAKAEDHAAAEGMQQAREYAEILDLKFAYATNGPSILEFDFTTGLERALDRYPTPDELFARWRQAEGLADDAVAERLLTPYSIVVGKTPRYYQEIAINRAAQALLQGRERVLLTMATGSGKTLVAFEICWKLWSSRWNRTGEYRRPRILYLADRNILVDDPKDKMFAPFGDARHKIEHGEVVKSREMYFAIYQAIAQDERRPGLYREYAPDFFDLVIVDECHRGSAADDSNWREILEYFEPAHQLGMTATPLREDNRNTYDYFGDPIYTYSLKQGIDDGFLAPYRVHRVVTTYDALGWRPYKGQRDRYEREIPDREYQTQDFERSVALKARTEAVARHLTDYLKRTDRFGKTIIFCVDQEHASAMRQALNNLNADLVKQHPNYVVRVTSEEGQIGKGHLGRFQDPEEPMPVIVTTSKLLTTGVDVPTCQNVVLVRTVNSMTEFKQIIGRGTRVNADYGKYFFNILDYTGSATERFADPAFDGDPVTVTQVSIDEEGLEIKETEIGTREPPPEWEEIPTGIESISGDEDRPRRKYYVDGGVVEVVAHMVYELDPQGHQLKVFKYVDYAGETVRTLYANGAALRKDWANPGLRADIIQKFAERGIDFDHLREATLQPEADPFDLLCHLAFKTPVRTRRERADLLRQNRPDFFAQYGHEAQVVLGALLEKYADHGAAQFEIPAVLKVPPISEHGNVRKIAAYFGGPVGLRQAVHQLQTLLYAS